MRFSSAFVAMAAPFLLVSGAPAYKRAAAIDITVLNFALTLERLETQFYNEALAKFKAEDFLKAGFSTAEVPIEQFKAIAKHEQAHIDFLLGALKAVGAAPLEGCKFDFSSVLGDVATMAAVARVVEYVGVSAYAGAATLVEDKNILSSAASILTIESRHQSLLNVLNGGSAIPQAFDMALSPSQVLALAGGFISGCDLGIPAAPALTVTNKGPVTVGTKLTFSSPGIDAAAKAGQAALSCQMLANGKEITQSQSIDSCIVPDGIDGPVFVYITSSPQPLQANLKNQCTDCQVAGPTLIFLDTKPEFLGQLARTGQPIKSDKTISAGDATQPGNTAPGSAAPGSAAPGSAAPGSAAPGSAAPGSAAPGSAAPGSAAPGSSTPGAPGSAAPGTPGSSAPGAPGSTPGASGSKPASGTPQPAQANALPAGVNLSTGLSAFDGAVVVHGWFTMPKDPAGAAPAASGTASGSASASGTSSAATSATSTSSSAGPSTTA